MGHEDTVDEIESLIENEGYSCKRNQRLGNTKPDLRCSKKAGNIHVEIKETEEDLHSLRTEKQLHVMGHEASKHHESVILYSKPRHRFGSVNKEGHYLAKKFNEVRKENEANEALAVMAIAGGILVADHLFNNGQIRQQLVNSITDAVNRLNNWLNRY